MTGHGHGHGHGHEHEHEHGHGHQFPYEKAAKLDSSERHASQPADRLVQLVAGWSPGAVLDIGVGTGYFAIPLARALPETSVTGVDMEPRMLELVRSRMADGTRITLREGSAEQLNVEPGFDVALMINLYHELPDRPAALAEVHRALQPGGRLVICDWRVEPDPEKGPPVEHRVDVAQAEAELREAGFDAIEQHAIYPSHYTLVGQRG